MNKYLNIEKVFEISNPTWDYAKKMEVVDLAVRYTDTTPFMLHEDKKFINMASCSYLGLDTHPNILHGASDAIYKVGALHLTTPRYKLFITMLADVASMLGGAIVANSSLGVNYSLFLNRMQTYVSINNYTIGIAKTFAFAWIIGMVGCFCGFRVKGNADSIGVQTTRSVVISICLIIFVDALFALHIFRYRLDPLQYQPHSFHLKTVKLVL